MANSFEGPKVTVREVGPRGGLQMAKAKLRSIAATMAAGVQETEVARFVPPAAMPKMAAAAKVTWAVGATHPALFAVALTPNLRGARNAAAAGAQAIILLPVSASNAPSQANVRRSRPIRRRKWRGWSPRRKRPASPNTGKPWPLCDVFDTAQEPRRSFSA